MSKKAEPDPKEREKLLGILKQSFLIIITCFLFIAGVLTFIIFNNKSSDRVAVIDIEETTSTPIAAELTPAIKSGYDLFKANCQSCHIIGRKVIGPDLTGITARREKEWLHAFIKNNVALRKSGDPIAIQVYEENNKQIMNLFPQLSKDDIDHILEYIDYKEVLVSKK